MNVSSKKQFAKKKEDLQKKDVRLGINTDAVNVNVFYPNVEFRVFKNGQYQFEK